MFLRHENFVNDSVEGKTMDTGTRDSTRMERLHDMMGQLPQR